MVLDLFYIQPTTNMDILFILIDDKLDAHYIISEDANNKEKPNQ